MSGQTSPLVLLGLDVGDPDEIERWAREGYLPTIASIMNKGCWARIGGPEMLSEQGLWFAMFNGVSRGKHGYYYFRQLKPGTYDLENFNGLNTGEQPFWSHLKDSGKRVAQIDVPDACPIPGLSGWQLLNWAIHNIEYPYAAPRTEPAELIREVTELFGPQTIINEALWAKFEVELRMYRDMLERIEKKGALCRKLIAKGPLDLFVTVFAESHTGTHQFWKHRPGAPKTAKAPRHELTNAIRDIYQAIDRQFGLILEQFPSNANVFILSSSGMEDHYPSIGLIDSFCRKLGFQATPQAASGPSLNPLAVARKLMPEPLRIAISRSLPRPVQDRLIRDQFRNGTDWTRTTAFNIPAHYNSFVRVNMRGREPQGIVEGGPGYESLLNRIEDDLRLLVDPVSGQAPVREVFRSSCYGEGLHLALPDLIIKWRPSRYFRAKLHHPKAELSQPVPGFFRDSEHSETGFAAAAGPAISSSGYVGEVGLLDLAPTFLKVMGQPIPEGMDGRPIPPMALA